MLQESSTLPRAMVEQRKGVVPDAVWILEGAGSSVETCRLGAVLEGDVIDGGCPKYHEKNYCRAL